MEIYLSYKGNISTTGHTKQKFKIRRHLLPQLRQLLTYHEENDIPKEHTFSIEKRRYVGDFIFLPLVSINCCKVVDLEIVLLSHFEPACTKHYPTGDIDNLLKSLLDGMRMPQNMNEVRSEKPQQNEDPFLCILEDDQLVRNIHIRHDRLLFANTEGKKDPKEIFVLVKAIILPKFG